MTALRGTGPTFHASATVVQNYYGLAKGPRTRDTAVSSAYDNGVDRPVGLFAECGPLDADLGVGLAADSVADLDEPLDGDSVDDSGARLEALSDDDGSGAVFSDHFVSSVEACIDALVA